MFFQAVSLKIATIKSQHAMAEAMKGVTKAMGRMNKNMKLPQIQKIMQGFDFFLMKSYFGLIFGYFIFLEKSQENFS